jgi:hypothetical protein
MTTKFPLLVKFAFHPTSKEAATAAEYLHEVLNEDPAVPGPQIQRPVYLVGAFGGCARLVLLDAPDGVPRTELTAAYHQSPHAEALRRLYTDRSVKWQEFEAIATELKACEIPGLENGLTVDENRELATSRSAERIVELVLHGLQQCYPPAAAGDAE